MCDEDSYLDLVCYWGWFIQIYFTSTCDVLILVIRFESVAPVIYICLQSLQDNEKSKHIKTDNNNS
jgi:hypothetical protein